jgi:hypothetical protein
MTIDLHDSKLGLASVIKGTGEVCRYSAIVTDNKIICKQDRKGITANNTLCAEHCMAEPELLRLTHKKCTPRLRADYLTISACSILPFARRAISDSWLLSK